MRVLLAFALPLLALIVVSGATAVFGLGYYETAWGRWNSLQVYLWIATPLSLLAGVGGWVGCVAAIDSPNPKRSPWLPGLLFAIAATAATWAAGPISFGPIAAFVFCAFGSATFSYLWFRRKSRHVIEG